MDQQNTSAGEVIDAVGGTVAFARWWKTHKATASRWRRRGIPSKFYPDMRERLIAEFGIDPPISAFSFKTE